MTTSWYNRPRKFDNGIVWMRWRSGLLKGWGIWIADRRAPKYDVGSDSAPWSPLILLRLPRWTVAVMHPSGDNL